MAIFKSLTFDGFNSLDYGIYITGEAVYNAPERAVEMVNIPGKNGALALDQGRFENIEVTYHAGCFADSQADFADKVMQFRNALASRYTYKRLTDEYHPDEYRLGLYKSGLDVDAVRYGTAGEFNIVFDCKPQRFLTSGETALTPSDYIDTQTATGEIVTIESDGSLGVKALKVSLEPIQDLNGYDHPWVGGAGKNVFDLKPYDGCTYAGLTYTLQENGKLRIKGTCTSEGWNYETTDITFPHHGINAGDNIYLYTNTRLFMRFYDASDTLVGDSQAYSATIPTTAVRAVVFIYPKSNVCNVGDVFDTELEFCISKVQLSSFEPYSNICPISGHTEVVTQRTGKNLLPNDIGSYSGGTAYRYITRIMPNGVRAYMSFTDKDTSVNVSDISIGFVHEYSGGSVRLFRWCLNDGRIADHSNVAAADTSILCEGIIIYPRTEDAFNRLFARYDIMVELGTTATEYEPYQGTTYTTALGQTVYGGTLDVVSGELVVDRAMVDISTLNWVYSESRMAFNVKPSGIKESTDISLFCSAYANDGRIASASEMTSKPNGVMCYQSNGTVFIKDTAFTDSVSFRQAVQGVQLCYELANPQTIQLTPQQIDLLLGTNHLWSDGEITVEYGVHPYYNPAPFDAKPLIKVTGTGTLGIGEYILTITGSATQTLYIDCETMEIYTLEGTVPAGASSLVSINKNDFPVLEPGTNYISVGSGITAVTIKPRWWRI